MLTRTWWAKSLERLKEIWLMPFRAIAAALKLFSRNRGRIREFGRRPRVAATLKYGMLITMLLWLAIALLNRGEDDRRLTDAIENLWSKPAGDQSQAKPSMK